MNEAELVSGPAVSDSQLAKDQCLFRAEHVHFTAFSGKTRLSAPRAD